jgi:hypothetical protein
MARGFGDSMLEDKWRLQVVRQSVLRREIEELVQLLPDLFPSRSPRLLKVFFARGTGCCTARLHGAQSKKRERLSIFSQLTAGQPRARTFEHACG